MVCVEFVCMMERAYVLQERRRSHRRSSEGASNVSEEVGEDEDDGEEDGDGGDSERSQGSDAGNDEADVKEEGNDEDNKEDETNDEAWMREKRHSGDGEVLFILHEIFIFHISLLFYWHIFCVIHSARPAVFFNGVKPSGVGHLGCKEYYGN